MALQQARLATCPRLQVGGIVIDEEERRILMASHNGAPRGEPHCLDKGCDVVNDHCRRAVHCEKNLAVYAGRALMRGNLVLITHTPCYDCAGLLVQTGIRKLIYLEHYRDANYSRPGVERLLQAGVEVLHRPLAA